jgi:hypothetical protein
MSCVDSADAAFLNPGMTLAWPLSIASTAVRVTSGLSIIIVR